MIGLYYKDSKVSAFEPKVTSIIQDCYKCEKRYLTASHMKSLSAPTAVLTVIVNPVEEMEATQ